MRLGDYKGKVLLINFWATWCAPCRAEMPDLVKLQKQFGPRGLQVLGITYPPQNRASVRQIAGELKINYPILLGGGKTASDYNVGEVLPSTVVVDREGMIRARILGILEPEEFDEQVRPLLETTKAQR
ncbi:MAG TPA: TlpA disulfide reductase family protein [Blastocatellia bacterium]|nr:TlpA disulfide reductase family protein [Blastocatellia bacterium]